MTPVLAVEVPMSAIFLGTIVGLTYGALAVGLILIYQSNRLINFAHGQVGVLAGSVLGLAVTRWSVPYWVALPAALFVGVLAGAISEVAVVRRLRRAPLLMSLVATLGLAQFLTLLSLAINSQINVGTAFPVPTGFPEFRIGGLLVTPAYSAMLILTPIVVGAVALFLSSSRHGKGIRAAAANPDAVRLSGMYASRMSTLAWSIGGVLAAYTAIMILPTRGFTNPEFLGPGLLLRALAVAVIAGMRRIPLALVGGVVIGIVEQLLLWNYPRAGLVEAVLFSLILVLLLLVPRPRSREGIREGWRVVTTFPPIPEHLSGIWYLRRAGWIVGVAAAGLAVVLGMLVTNATAVTLTTMVGFAIVGLSVGVVSGLAGQLSLGQLALAAIGAAVSVAVTAAAGNILVGLIAGGLAAAVASLLVGIPALRISGLMLAVATLGFALAANSWLLRQPWLLGSQGAAASERRLFGWEIAGSKSYYLFSVGALVVIFLLVRNIWKGGVSRRTRAVRDNPDAARSFGLSATWVKLQSFALSGFVAGVGGAVMGHGLSVVSTTSFPVGGNLDVVAMSVLGGIGLIAGPILGSLFVIGVPQFFPVDNAALAATALGWLLLILYFPGGLAQLIKPVRDQLIRWAERRAGQVEVPSRDDDPGRPATLAIASERSHEHQTATGVILETDGLVKSFGGVHAVDGVSLKVGRGETVGLIGPNGAGKTTLFDLVSGFVRPDRGKVFYSGAFVGGKSPEALSRMGLVRSFQDAALFPTLTVGETLLLATERRTPTAVTASLLGMDFKERSRRARAREVSSMTGLDRYWPTRVAELSTGTRRIVEVGCMIILEPELLLLDEPSSGIAQSEVEALADVLRQVRDQFGLSLLIIEHDIRLLSALSDRLYAMESGRVIAAGTPAEVTSDPAVVESYLGEDKVTLERIGPSIEPGRVGR